MDAAPPRRRSQPKAATSSRTLRVLLALLLATATLQFVAFRSVIHEVPSSRKPLRGFVAAWRSAFRNAPPPPPPPDFDRARDGDLSGDYECVGWRETSDCSPDGERELSGDRPCDANITKDRAGYCEFRRKDVPETVRRVFKIHCDTLRQGVTVQCQDVPRYLAYGENAVGYTHDPEFSIAANQRELLELNGLSLRAAVSFDRGIVFAVYEPGLLSVYASIQSLRARGCTLPIELWCNPNETSEHHPLLQELLTVENVFRREIRDRRAARFFAKLYAVLYSAFDSVLLMDTDNFAVRDPAYLFDTPAFQSTGAVFWPDYWRPNQTIFHIHERNLLWPIFGLSFVDMFEQESGQVLIDRRRHVGALNVLMYFGFSLPRVHEDLRILWGDKDLFRLAWMKTNSSFHYIQRPPGSAGRQNARTRLFCGLTMAQHDPSGDIIFLHRNTMKLSADPVTRQIQWTHIQQFRQDVPMELYDIQRSWDVFPEIPKCWGKPSNFALSHTLTPISEFDFRDLEKELLAFAQDGLPLLDAWTRMNAANNLREPPPDEIVAPNDV